MTAHATAEDFLPTVPASSVGLILTDPPYFRVKSHAWDRQWSNADRFVAWLSGIADEWARVLAPNGTLICFAGSNATAAPGATLAARVEVMLAERFNVVASAVWVKADAQGNGKFSVQKLDGLRTYFPQTERAIICEHHGADNIAKGEAGYVAKCDELRGFVFEPLRAYLDGERKRAGLSVADVAEAWRVKTGAAKRTGMAGHWFSAVQWALPTPANYGWLRSVLGDGLLRREYGFLRREYEDLRREYEDLRREYEDLRREYEDLRRPFHGEQGAHHTDVWTYPTVPARTGKHPCEKPEAMGLDLVRQCSRPGDVVLDTFAGSGVFLAAAEALGRVPIGCDADERWATRATDRVRAADRVLDDNPAAGAARDLSPQGRLFA